MSEFLVTLSSIFGWLYFFAWSASFWPQAILNYQRKSVRGLTLDFQLYNLIGFLSYTTYTIYKYVADEQLGAVQTVFANDIAFGVHAVFMTCVVLTQFVLFGRNNQSINQSINHSNDQSNNQSNNQPNQVELSVPQPHDPLILTNNLANKPTITSNLSNTRGYHPPSPVHLYIKSVLIILTAYTLLLALTDSIEWYCPTSIRECGARITFIEYLGYMKALISLIKYTPQAMHNYERKSTIGWSISNILLDLTGGTLSFAQQGIDAINQSSIDPLTGNLPKLGLALISIAFDCLFIFQHYVLYKDSNHPDHERINNTNSSQPLLQTSSLNSESYQNQQQSV